MLYIYATPARGNAYRQLYLDGWKKSLLGYIFKIFQDNICSNEDQQDFYFHVRCTVYTVSAYWVLSVHTLTILATLAKKHSVSQKWRFTASSKEP